MIAETITEKAMNWFFTKTNQEQDQFVKRMFRTTKKRDATSYAELKRFALSIPKHTWKFWITRHWQETTNEAVL